MIKLNKQRAFTLIEILVGIVISGMVLSSVLAASWQMIKMRQITDASRQLQKEMHFSLIRIADKIRSYSIDYNAYEVTGECNGVSILSSQKLCVGDDNVFEIIDDKLTMNNAPLMSDIFKVTNFVFKVTPTKDPSLHENKADQEVQLQPKVTVYFRAEAKNLPQVHQVLQTTISSRVYR